MENLVEKPPLTDDIDFQRWQSRFQRIGWSLLLLFLIATFLGFTGSGPFASQRLGGQNFAIECQRVAHRQAPTELRVHFLQIPPGASVTVHVNQDYLDSVSVESISPEPSRQDITAHGQSWTVSIGEGDRSGQLRFEFRPSRPGLAQGAVTVDTETLRFQQLILP